MNKVLDFIKESENGVTEDLICAKFPMMKKIELATTLNDLLHHNQIEIFKDGDCICYKSVHNRTSDYEGLVLNLIAQSGSNGLWLKDIKSKTNIPHNLVLKILKLLEDNNKIRCIKSVKNNRKTYVMFDVKPAEEISGGIWFSNNDVDLVFVNKLMEVIYRFISKPEEPFILNKIDNLVKFRSIQEFIANSGISQVELSLEDIGTLIDCLCYDGKVERIEYEGSIVLRALKDDYMHL